MKTVSERRAIKTLTEGQVTRLVDNLRMALTFINANLPADVQTEFPNALRGARDALHRRPDTNANVTEMGAALRWCMSLIVERYEGPGTVIADGLILLAELGLIPPGEEVTDPDQLAEIGKRMEASRPGLSRVGPMIRRPSP